MHVRAAAVIVAASLLALPALADETLVPVLGEIRVTREAASLEIQNGGEAPFVVDARLEFTDLESKAVIASVSFLRATVGAGKGTTIRLTAPIHDRETLPLSAYLVRVIVEATAAGDMSVVAVHPAAL